ncbi:hypothetical protein [Nostoc commune]|nr:hypothetical protein [Nostoc commune]
MKLIFDINLDIICVELLIGVCSLAIALGAILLTFSTQQSQSRINNCAD